MAAAIVLAGAYFLTTFGVDPEFPINGDNVSNLNTEEIIRKIADAENLEDGSLLCANVDNFDLMFTSDFDWANDGAIRFFYTEREKETIEELFPACESISIDYAVMEKAERIYVLPAEFGWSDLGSWGSLHSLLPKDERNNAVVGENVRMYECNNCIVHTPHLKQAVIQGLDGYIIAEKEGTLLICRLAEEQRIKEFSKA